MDGHLNDSAENRKAATPPLYLPPPAASRSSNIYSNIYTIYSVHKVSISKGGLGFSSGFVY